MRIPPHDNATEMDVLGACLVSPEAVDTAVGLLTFDDFHSKSHQKIYKCIGRLHEKGQPVDITTVANLLNRHKNLDKVGGRVYLSDLSDYSLSPNIEEKCAIVGQKSSLRKVISTFTKGIHECYGHETAEKIIDRVESVVMGLSSGRKGNDAFHVKDIIPDNLEDLDKILRGEKKYMLTGLEDLDNLVVGLTDSDLIICAGRPGMGKSALGMNIAENLAEGGDAVGIFSLEMSKEQLTKRIQYGIARVSGKKAELGEITEEDLRKVTDASNHLAGLPIYIDDNTDHTSTSIRAAARRMVSKQKVKLIIVDYIQLIEEGKGNTRNEEMGIVTRNLKKLAKELHIPVIALSQLSRAVEARNDRRPLQSDLRDSGSIEQDADEIWMVYREVEYLQHLSKRDSKRIEFENKAEIIIRKNRDGETGIVHLNFQGSFTRFENLSMRQEN